MGRKSREKQERRQRQAAGQNGGQSAASRRAADSDRGERVRELEGQLSRLADGDYESWGSPTCPDDLREAHLQDVLAFESVESGTSLFEGLQEHGLELPRPEQLDEEESADKVLEIVNALAGLGVFLIGFEHLTACELYSTLFNETLWEGCYIKRKHPGSITMIDVSHGIPRSGIRRWLKSMCAASAVH